LIKYIHIIFIKDKINSLKKLRNYNGFDGIPSNYLIFNYIKITNFNVWDLFKLIFNFRILDLSYIDFLKWKIKQIEFSIMNSKVLYVLARANFL
jgi:hypothetical protein